MDHHPIFAAVESGDVPAVKRHLAADKTNAIAATDGVSARERGLFEGGRGARVKRGSGMGRNQSAIEFTLKHVSVPNKSLETSWRFRGRD